MLLNKTHFYTHIERYVNRGASQEVIEQNTLPHTYKKVRKQRC